MDNKSKRRRTSSSRKPVGKTGNVRRGSNRSLQKIQPKSVNNRRKKGISKVKVAGVILAILLVVYMIFIFEMPANYPKEVSVESIRVDSASISLKMNTNTYKNKLIPLEYLLALGDGDITLVEEKEQTITFSDGTVLVLREGSRKIKIDGKNERLNAPVMTLDSGLILVPGEIIEVIYPDNATFIDGIATFNLGGEKGEDFSLFTGSEGYLRLVNQQNKLTAAYAPTDLVEVNTLGSIPAYGNNTQLRKQAADALVTMYDESGLTNLIMSSGFRNFEEQTRIFEEDLNSNIAAGLSEVEAEEETKKLVAVPGTSEHQLGLAVDFSIPEQVLTEEFKNTEAGIWLGENSYKYGFILRYLQEYTETTGIIYEPWHFRYIGYPHSEIVFKDGVPFDDYIIGLRDTKIRHYEADDGNSYIIWMLSDELVPINLEYAEENGVSVSTDNMDNVILTIPK